SALGELAADWPPLEGGGSKLPQERLPMRKIKEVLRLQSLGLSQRQIAASCAVGQATVSDYLKTAEAAGLRWPDIAEWSEDQVMQAVAPSREKTRPAKPVTRAGLRGYPPRVANPQARHLTTAVGRVPGEPSGRLPLQPLL